MAFYAGGSSPPARSPVYGSSHIVTYSDSADGNVWGFFGQLRSSRIIQLGVYVVSRANALVVPSGPFPVVAPAVATPFDHTGDNIGVSKIGVYYDNYIGIFGLRFTYVTRLGIKYTTPLYGQKRGLYKQVEFDYLRNPLVNVGIYASNVLAGKDEVGVICSPSALWELTSSAHLVCTRSFSMQVMAQGESWVSMVKQIL